MIKPVQKELYAVVGNPVNHSLSPLMMQTAFERMNHQAVYAALQLDEPREDFSLLHRVGFKGLSVTLPHKEQALQSAEEVDETARIIGAVNTLKRGDVGWIGCNTDWKGSNGALISVSPLKGKRGLVLGAGGAARAVVYGLQQEGAEVTICNRGEERGASLARTFQCAFIPLKDLGESLESLTFDLVVQCTPVGLAGDSGEAFVPPRLFHEGMMVLDTVYRPLRTPFVKEAMKKGCTVVSGLEMLLQQGVEQLKFWLEIPTVHEEVIGAMREALQKAVT